MKNLYKFTKISIIVPFILSLVMFITTCFLSIITITEPTSAFPEGKFPMLLVILFFFTASLWMAFITKRNLKNVELYMRRFTKEEKKNINLSKDNENQEEYSLSDALMGIIAIIIGIIGVYAGISSEENDSLMWIVLGFCAIFGGIFIILAAKNRGTK